MITNFEEYFAAQKASNWELQAENLSMAEQLVLRALVSCWGDEELRPTKDVLSDYYCLEIPNQVLIEIFHADLDLAAENATHGISDTCQRDILVSAVLKKIGSRPWPTYSEGDEVFNQFLADLPKKLEAIGGKLEV